MLNPIHKDLPPFVIILQAVCNKFDHMMVRNQWSSITELYNQYLLDVLGPLVGHASDGDVRRRKLHLEDSNSIQGVRYSIDHENFTFSGRLDEVNGKKFVVDLSDQDYVHNGKKIVNHLMHPSRVLSLGGNLCFMNNLQLLVNNEHMSSFDHGLQQPDIERRDRMNWESTQRLLFPKVRDCLMKIHNGEILPQENTSGTITYLQMAWRYVEIFYSLELSLTERIQCVSYVCNFLRIWRLWVYKTGSLTLQHNFVSRETFQDVCLSCHHVVLFIKASRDFAPTQAICLERLRTDVCEEYFSSNGSFVLNKHNYTITDMFRNLCNMQRLQEIYADSSGPDNPKKHRKGENIWMKGHRKPAFPADLHDFPSDEEMAKAWEMGLREAQQKLREMGITPQDDDESNDGNNWFFWPHKIDSTTDAGIFA